MSRVGGVVILSFLMSFPLLGGDQPQRLQSRFETQLHLFQPHRRADTEFRNRIADGSVQKKSAGLAAIYSLLLPGLGELYADGFSSGKYFMIAEGALWLTYTGIDVYGNSLRDDARAFAVAHAGVDTRGKDDQFFVDVGNFGDVNEYNEKQLRDREPENLYDPRAGYDWRWTSDDLRAQYRAQRIDAENMFNNRKFVVAVVIINHVASAINAARSAIAFNKAIEESGELHFGASVMGGLSHPHGVLLTVSRDF